MLCGFNPPGTTYTLNVVLFNKKMHQCLCPAVTEMAYIYDEIIPKLHFLHEIRIMGDGPATILSQLLTKKTA